MVSASLHNEFGFFLPTRIVFGTGSIQQVATHIRETCKGKRIFLVTDPGIIRAGIIEPIQQALTSAGYEIYVFDEVAPNPKDIDCEKGATEIRQFGADLVLAVGGGSVIDSAKAIALLHTHPGSIHEYEGKNRILHDVTPLVAIPTTSGTGAEVTRSAVITDTSRLFKMTIKDTKLAPKLAILDPFLTVNLPPTITASTGMDAFVHAIEAFTCKVSNPISDALALSAMERIWHSLRLAVQDGSNLEAREEMMLGSLLAGIAFSHADVASVHCMAEALGGLYDTPHGVANSIFLPVVTAFNAEADIAKHAKVARVCKIVKDTHYDRESTRLLVDALYQLASDIGIPSLRSLPYVQPADFPRLAEAAFQNGSTPSNCRTITTEEYLSLFEQVYEQSHLSNA